MRNVYRAIDTLACLYYSAVVDSCDGREILLTADAAVTHICQMQGVEVHCSQMAKRVLIN
jgi:hypothetical protein